MCDENIEIGVTEITNNILVSAQPTDQIIDINVLEEVENVELTITPSVVEVNIDVTQELITEVVTIDANTCVNIVDVTVTDATDNVVLNVTPSLVEVNINRGENNLSIEEYDTFADLPTIGDTDTYYITLDENKFWRWDAIDEVYVEIASSDDKIPYLGAYKNSDLGEWGIKSNWFGLDTTPTNPPTAVGTLTWNDTDGTADLILKGGNVTLQIGQEQVLRVVNKTGATLNEADFRAVRVRSVAEGGAQGQRLAVLLAQADSDADSATTIGLVTESIANNQEGFITTSGNVNKINTTGAKSFGGAETWSDGDILYLSPTHAGYLTNVKPQAPNHTVIIGWVVYAHANNGKIFVKVDNGYELDELHNVRITTPTTGQALVYDSALGYWKNASVSSSLSATSPLSITSNVISISQANATTNGFLSSADWNYFSAKQQPLSGTGFVKATGSVISYDNTVYTPQSRTLTINGTSYDLSADRSWSISVGSGMRNVSSFVATSGQTTFTIVGGYTAGLVDVFVNGVRLNGGDYTATNGTTVVLSVGAIANDLVDIINYTASLTSGITGSGTTNYIPKWSGSTNLTNSAIYNGVYGVGIYTTTPRSAFEVNGQIYASNGGVWTEDGQGFLIGDLDAGASYAFISGVGSTGAASHLTFSTNYTERVRIVANGNVGIGLTNPAYKLDVVGDVNVTGSFRVNGVAIGGGSGTVTGTGTANYIAKWSGISAIGNSIIFDNGTNVGIGTASPAEKLAVNGNIRIDNGAADGGQLVLASSGFSDWNIDNFSGSLRAYYGSTEYFRLTNLGQLLIGTTTVISSEKVSIIGTASTNGVVRIENSVNQFDVNHGILNLVNTASYAVGNDASIMFSAREVFGTIHPRASIGAKVSSTLGADLVFNTRNDSNYAERMRITSSGNVGIGTTSPTQKLDVNGAIKTLGDYYGVNNTPFSTNGTITVHDTVGLVLKGITSFVFDFAIYSTGTSGSPLLVNPTGTTNLNFPSGIVGFTGTNVGIGTTTPSTGFGGTINNVKLAIRNGTPGQAGGTSVLLIGGDNNHYSYLEAQHTGGGNTYLSFGTSTGAVNPTEKMRITSGGDILIGKTATNWQALGTQWEYSGRLMGITSNFNAECYFAHKINQTGNFHFFLYNYIGVGSISTNGSSTSFNTTSDYRLKEDLRPINGLEKLSKINVYDFKWKSSNDRMDGVIAHELQEILPYAVTGIKDGKDLQGVDYSKIVPVLVQAIKELNAKLEAK